MLIPVLLAVIALLAFGGRPLGRALRRGAAVWRPTSGLLAVAALTGAAVLAVREDWVFALLFLLIAAGLALGARKRKVRAPSSSTSMSRREAAAILGVAEGAPADVVEAAYRRLIRMAHPDQGGTPGLAAQLNAARAAMRGG